MSFGAEGGERVTKGEISRWSAIPLVLPLLFVVALGLYMPESFTQLIHHASVILTGGNDV
jgi:hypothetical protein